MSYRLHQVNENVQRELSQLLAEAAVTETGLVTITQVLTTPDLRAATIWVSILYNPHPEKVIESLNERAPEFFSQLSPRLKMKYAPQLTFKLDEHSEELTKLDSLMDEIHNDDHNKTNEA
jgi:ribosome-binding factor A